MSEPVWSNRAAGFWCLGGYIFGLVTGIVLGALAVLI